MIKFQNDKKKKLPIMLGITTGIIALIFLVNQITVYPFIYCFRALMSLVDGQGNIGPYAETITYIKESDTIPVQVPGYPDSFFTLYYPDEEQKTLPVIMYIHGGGWSTGNASAVKSFAKLLALNGYIVANVDYSLAPEYAYPTSTYQLVETLNYLYENADQYGIDNQRIFIGGNSAGAHLASQIGGLVSNHDYASEVGVNIRIPAESVKGLLLFNGVYNFDTVGSCKFPGVKKFAWSYTGKKNYTAYERIDELSTVKHITEKYPEVFITVGDADPLESQTIEFIDSLKNYGINYTSLLWSGTDAGLYHDYIYELNTKEAQNAYNMVIDFLNKY